MASNNNKLFMDFREDDDEDLYFTPGDGVGDIEITESDEMHITDIMTAFPGEFKEFPEVGVGIVAYLNSSRKQQEIARSVQVQLEGDGYTVKSPNFQTDAAGGLIILPDATR